MALRSKRLVENLVGEKAPGPSTTFSVFHIFSALELMAKKPIGRNKLAEKLDVGEGAIRTIISRMKDGGLIATSRAGCKLTRKGLGVWKELENVFPVRVEIEKNDLITSNFNYAFLVKNCGHKIKRGIEQRDAAIVAGAKKAVVLVAKHGNIAIETVSEDIEKDFPTAARLILKNIKPEDNDLIMVAGADSLSRAKQGAFAASWMLIQPDE